MELASFCSQLKVFGRKGCMVARGHFFEGHIFQVRHKQDYGRGFILLLLQAAVLPRSDTGSDGVGPASNFVIQNRQISCSMWFPMLGRGLRFVQWRRTRNLMRKQDSVCAWANEISQHQFAGNLA